MIVLELFIVLFCKEESGFANIYCIIIYFFIKKSMSVKIQL